MMDDHRAEIEHLRQMRAQYRQAQRSGLMALAFAIGMAVLGGGWTWDAWQGGHDGFAFFLLVCVVSQVWMGTDLAWSMLRSWWEIRGVEKHAREILEKMDREDGQ